MHIGFLTLEYPPLRSGGIGTSTRTLARALVRAGHRVSVIGWGQAASFDDEGVGVRFLGHTPIPAMGWLLHRRRARAALHQLVTHERLAIVEAHDWGGPSAGIRLGCPIVVRCNGSARYFGALLGEPVRWQVSAAETLALRQAAAVAAVSQFAADTTARLFQLRAPVTVIPNGVDLTSFASSAAPFEPGLIVYVGTIVRKKGVIDLCRIFSQLVERMPDARLLIAGRDAADRLTGSRSTWQLCQSELTAAAGARTTYLGEQTPDAIRIILSRAAVCIFPSYAEALPVVWIEAMACARPIVGYASGWAGELIDHGTSGLVVEPGDIAGAASALESILRDPVLTSRMGARARERAIGHSDAAAVAQQTVSWYEQVREAHRCSR